MIVWQDDLFVFGGVSRSKDGSVVPYATHDDLWRFDTQDMAWSMLSDHMGPKNKRMARGGVVEADGHKRLLIYGGEPINPSRSVFPLDQETWAWNIAEGDWTRGADGPARNMASIGVNADGALVFGGDKEGGVSLCGAPFDQNVTNDLFLYDVEEDAWTEIAGIANIPPPVKRTAGVWTAGYFYVFGGFNFVCRSEEDPGQIWNEKVYRIKFSE